MAGRWAGARDPRGGPEALPPSRPQFEWAWQHPQASRRLAHVAPRLRSEAAFAFHLRVLAHMLRAPPWARLPLTLRWLRADFRQDLCLPPPPHVPVAFGPPPPRMLAPKRAARPFADTEPEPDQDAEAPCTLCARALQVRGSPGPQIGAGLEVRRLRTRLSSGGWRGPATALPALLPCLQWGP